MKLTKPVIAGISALAIIAISVSFSSSYSANNLLDFSQIMQQQTGTSTIIVTGESSMTVPPDAAMMVLSINSPPTGLQEAITNYNQNARNVSEDLKEDLSSFDNVTISYISTSFDGNHYNYMGNNQVSDSFVAYMSFPIKVDIEKYQQITKDITNLGLRINDIRISKVPVENSEKETLNPAVKVSVVYDSAIPGCEETGECFIPSELTVDAGTEVIWSNDDQAAHTVTSGTPENGPDGIFDSSLFMAGNTFSYVFDVPGEYPYFCLVHPWMVGKVIVGGEVNPDQQYLLEATINVNLETKPDTLDNTLSSYTKTLDDLSVLLEENGISGEIPRSSININPSYYSPGVFDTYQTYARWTVKTPTDNLESVYDILSKYGSVERIYLTYSRSSVDLAREELTQEALDDARIKAMEITNPMNLEIKAVKSISINQNFDQQRNPQMIYGGVVVSIDEWNNIRDGNLSVMADVEFEIGK